MCHSIHYFTIVFNISLLQYVQLVSNVSLSCILYMLLPFDVGIDLLTRCKQMYTFIKWVEFIVRSLKFCYGALLSRLLEISAYKKYLIIIIIMSTHSHDSC